MFKFVGSNSEGLPLKRRQTQHACHECRRRKKRCSHLDANDKNDDRSTIRSVIPLPAATDPQSPIRSPIAPSVASQRGTVSNSANDDTPPLLQSDSGATVIIREDSSWRERKAEDDPSFIGDLNPEGTFLAGRSPSVAESATDSAGIWLQRMPLHGKTNYSHRHLGSINGRTTLLSKLVFSHLEESCLRQVPNKEDYQALRSIYVEQVHPVFPVLDYSSIPLPSDESPLQIMFKQAICLAASTTPLAKSHLNLPLENGSWSLHLRKDFAHQMSTSIRTSIYLGLVRNRISMLQVFSLLSLFTQLADDGHSSAEDTASAVSYLHTIGLHLETQEKRSDHEFVTRLFCCVWLLDRLNAAFHGRPVLLHERDFGRDLEKCFAQQDPAFQLLLRVALLLDQVIALYRPATDGGSTGWDEGFPAFEELIHRSGASGVRSGLLATIETLYHAVAMLTYRSKSMTEVVRSSASFVRQKLSATAITHVVATEYRGQLSLLPVVPYAVSLALRYAYRELRLTKTIYNRERAKRQLITSCDILRELAETFPAAMLMVELADQTLREMDKVVSSILSTQQQSTKHGRVGGNGQYGNARETTEQALHQGSQQAVGTVLTDEPFGHQTQEVAPLPLDGIDIGTNFDVFDYFDPNFNLDAIDAMLGDNIELSFPYILSSPET